MTTAAAETETTTEETTDAATTATEETTETVAAPGTEAWEKKVDALFDEDSDAGDEVPPADAADEGADEDDEAGQEVDADEGAEEQDDQDESGESAELVLRLPGRRPKDKPIELPLDAAALEKAGITPAQAQERLAQLHNGFMRGEEVRSAREEIESSRVEIDTDRAELDEIEAALRERPVSFINSMVDPKMHRQLAQDLLMRLPDAEFDALLDDVAAWERDPSARREARTTAKEQEIADREEARKNSSKRSATQATVKEISTALVGLIPETMDEAKADEFYDFALYKLETHVRANPGKPLRGDEIPALLEQLGALAPFGLTAKGGKARPSVDGSRTPPTRRTTRPVDEEAAARSEQTKADLKARTDKRRNAASTPSGVGSAATADARPPKGQNHEQRMGWLEKRLGLK